MAFRVEGMFLGMLGKFNSYPCLTSLLFRLGSTSPGCERAVEATQCIAPAFSASGEQRTG